LTDTKLYYSTNLKIMDSTDFIRHFNTIFDEEPLAAVTLETNFRDIEGWSSLIALAFIAMAEEDFGVKVKVDDIRNSSTVDDLLKLIDSKKLK
jgi:acyl carrier protein